MVNKDRVLELVNQLRAIETELNAMIPSATSKEPWDFSVNQQDAIEEAAHGVWEAQEALSDLLV